MRRGCIAVGNVACYGCHRSISYGEHYLVTDEEGTERQRLCIDCCRTKGYATYRTNKERQIETFLGEG